MPLNLRAVLSGCRRTPPGVLAGLRTSAENDPVVSVAEPDSAGVRTSNFLVKTGNTASPTPTVGMSTPRNAATLCGKTYGNNLGLSLAHVRRVLA